MVIKNAKFITSAAESSQFISPDKPMIAVCGKSNVGKSSFINMLASQKKLAKTSSTPGRTRLVNYFDFGEFILVDLPGYGYAEVSKTEKAKWAKTLDKFFERKGDITHVLALADIRHEPTENDVNMIKFLYYHAIPFTVVATKADKVAKSKLISHVKMVANGFGLGEGNVIPVSTVTKKGKEAVLERIEEVISFKAEDEGEE